MSDDSNFYQNVITLVRAIPEGKVITYGFLAELLGAPRAARAVGYALRTQKTGTDVPWFRVVGKRGKMGKVTIRPFGREEQIARLKDEGIVFDEQDEFPLIIYLWQPTPEDVKNILKIVH